MDTNAAHTQRQRRLIKENTQKITKARHKSLSFFYGKDAHRVCEITEITEGMGGCCCSSRKPHLHGTPVFYYFPPDLEEHESFTSNNAAVSALATGLLVDLDLEASIPDTFQALPVPLPYDMVLGCPQSKDSGSIRETVSSFETLATCEDLEEMDCKTQASSLPVSPRKSETSKLAVEEEDACPICLEEYDEENPKLMTKCEHHFHLSCILEWMERSDACPICDQEVKFGHTDD